MPTAPPLLKPPVVRTRPTPTPTQLGGVKRGVSLSSLAPPNKPLTALPTCAATQTRASERKVTFSEPSPPLPTAIPLAALLPPASSNRHSPRTIPSERARWARDYMRRRGDLEEMLTSDASTLNLTSATLAYIDLLEQMSTGPTRPGGSASNSETGAEGLWALLPVPEDEWGLVSTSPHEFIHNPLCTDRTPLVGTRRGGKEQPHETDRHSQTTVTVHMAAEGSAALYGQYLTRQALSGSLRCNLTLSVVLPDGFSSEVTIRAVVDTGAAWTAVRLDAALEAAAGSGHKLTFQKSDLSFTGVAGKQLRCLGWTVLRIRLGALVIKTKAFVFPDMHEPMLLGMNTLSAEALCVDVGNMALYESPNSQLPPDAVPLFVEGSTASKRTQNFFTDAQRNTLYYAPTGTVCAALPCSTPDVSHFRGGSKFSKLAHNDPDDADDDGMYDASSLLSLSIRSEMSPNERTRRLHAIESLHASGHMRRPDDYLATAITITDTIIKPGEVEAFHLRFAQDVPGVNRTLSVAPNPQFRTFYPELSTGTEVELVFLHASAQRVGQYRMQNTSTKTITVPAGTVFGSACGLSLSDSNSFNLQHHPEWVQAQLDNTAYRLDMNNLKATSAGGAQATLCALLAISMATPQSAIGDPADSTGAEDESVIDEPAGPTRVTAEFEGIGASAVEFEYKEVENYRDLPFDKGGRPRNRADLESIGLVLSEAVDASKPACPPLEGPDMQALIDVCAEHGAVWSRNAKVPAPARHPWARCEINTGDATPIKQKPYPIPQKYLEAVRKEIDGLLKAGLIEPGFGNWASPVICIVKKDSSDKLTAGDMSDIRIKLACDFRLLNASTVVDCALLGDQADILQCFHGRPHVSLCDAAGGFYQFLIAEADRQKTGFCLPSSCGGTLFQWRVAPYGLTNMPAIYSRAMQHVLRGMVDVDLGHELDDEGRVIDPKGGWLGLGSAPTWVDDITLASGGADPGMGIKGHCELLSRVFQRLILAGMTLKPSKSDLLRAKLKVLGFEVTRDGIAPQQEKVEAIMNIPSPTDPNRVLAFLGIINFNRAFIPSIAHIAHPLYETLKGYQSRDLKPRRYGAPPRKGKPFLWTDECEQAFVKLKQTLADNCLMAHPDLTDPNAELVLMTDASTLAAGAVLMQWQRRQPWEEVEIPEVTEADGLDATIAQRLKAGYTLRTLGFFSKTFANAQVNWAIFDKEAASIVLALTHWHRLIAGRPITVYTDNTVATSILTNTKFPRPPRLQRWGIVLGSYLPLLRIAYRKGELNPVADLLSRYPAYVDYKPKASDIAAVPDDLFDHILSVQIRGRRFLLSEPKETALIEQIWAELGEEPPPGDAMNPEPTPEEKLTSGDMNALLARLRSTYEADSATFERERERADAHLDHWAHYVPAFRRTFGRAPVLYDLYCGGGGFGRGAARAGFIVVGVDLRLRSPAYGREGLGRNLSNQFLREDIAGMYYVQDDVESTEFWDGMESPAGYRGFPLPDIIHASPPCGPHSALKALPTGECKDSPTSLTWMTNRLIQYQQWASECVHRTVHFSLENVEGARMEIEDLCHRKDLTYGLLCGTMFGLRVFRHRLFLTSAPLMVELPCSHEGKGVGKRGINRTGLNQPRYAEGAISNMFAPYSWYQPSRGTRDELHLAMGFEPGAMGSYKDLTLSLPPDYGEYVACQLLAFSMRDNIALPVISYTARQAEPTLAEVLHSWSVDGFSNRSEDRRKVGCSSDAQGEQATPYYSLHHEAAAYSLQRWFRSNDRFDGLTLRGANIARRRHDLLPARVQSRWTRLVLRVLADYSDVLHSTLRLNPLQADLPEQPADHEIDDANDDPEEDSVRPVADPPRGRRKRSGMSRPEFEEDEGTPANWKGPWLIRLDDQLIDPECRTIYESLTVTEPQASEWSKTRQRKARRHRSKYFMHAGRVQAVTAEGPRILVPAQLRYDLTALAHRTLDLGGHRGLAPLYDQMSARYYWDGMLSDCDEVVQHCEVCRVRDMSHQLHPRFTAMPDPPHPFHHIYIDYKDVPGSENSDKNAILIIVDGLTRYVIAVPTNNKTAETTLKALINNVFTVHSLPSVIRSDNGPEFDNALMQAFTAFAGYRHIKVLPYNACANGKAESTVKRVQELLIKHCRLLDNWADTLPMVCFALNCVQHSSTPMSPFQALFGRKPVMIPELEDPSGYRATYSGPDFLRNLVDDLRRSWDAVRDASDAIRTSAIKRSEKSRKHWDGAADKGGCAGINVGDWVLLKHGSDAHAKIRRKHGYPAYRRFRVVRLIPEAAAVELDVRRTTIHPVVSIRQCKRAPDEWYLFNDGSLSSGRYDGPLKVTSARGNPHEVGGRLPGEESEDDPDTHQDACMYPVEWILEAFHSKRKWWYRVLWLGIPVATWESDEDLRATGGADVLQWMAEARERFQAKYRRRREQGQALDDDESPIANSSVLDRDLTEDLDIEDEDDVPFAFDDLPDFEPSDPEAMDSPSIDPHVFGDVAADELGRADSRAVRELQSAGLPPVSYANDDRARRRQRRATQLMLDDVNYTRTLSNKYGQRINSLFIPSLLS